jgi:hypothetical protein
MKQIFTISLLFLTLIFNACNSTNESKDADTGAISTENGLSSKVINIQINDVAEKRSTFKVGESVVLAFNGIEGLTRVKGSAFPGISMLILKNGKDTILSEANLLNDLKNGIDLAEIQLKASLFTDVPHDENYTAYVRIWDTKSDKDFHYELPFKIEKNDLLKIDAKTITYSNIYLWNNSKKQVAFNKNINKLDSYVLILEGIDGLEATEGKVFPSISIRMTDKDGVEMLSNPNLLSSFEAIGLPAEKLQSSKLPVALVFSDGVIYNPCQLEVIVKDLKSDGQVTIKTELVVN